MMKFFNAGQANAEIARLSKELGIEPGPKIFKIKAANQRFDELEKMLAAKVPAKPQQATPAPAAAPVPIKPPIVKLTGIDAVLAGARADMAAANKMPAPVFARQAPAASALAAESQQVTRAQLRQILTIVEPTNPGFADHWTDEECRIETERCCFQSHLNFPQFMNSDAELENEYWRTAAPSGTGRYLRAEAKRKITAILNNKP